MRLRRKLVAKMTRFFRNKTMPKHTKLIIVSALVGIIVGLTSVLFKHLTEFVQEGGFQFLTEWITGETIAVDMSKEKILEGLKQIPWYIILFMPALGGLFVGIFLNYFFSEAKGGGVEEVMTSVATKRGAISFKTVVGKLVASAVTIGTGGSAGREGPIVQIGGGLGSCIARWLNLNEEQVKTLAGAGVAAGIAAAFNAPIAGAFFALEIILGDFALNTFSTIIIASVSATVVSRSFLGNSPIFAPEIVSKYYSSHSYDFGLNVFYEFGFYILLGIIAGFVCVLFIKTLFFTEHFFKKLKLPAFVKPAIGGLLVGLIGLKTPEILGVGYDTIENVLLKSSTSPLFNADGTWFTGVWLGLIIIIFGKIVATSFTLGSGGSGGTIVPSLFLGCVLGGVLGVVFHHVLPLQLDTGAYALVGMSAIIAGTTQAPIMAIMLFFEATNNYNIILPVMIVSIISSLITKSFLGGSLYTVKLKEQGINLYEGIEKTVMSTINVSEIMTRRVYMFHITTPFRVILESFLNVKHQVAFVVNDDDELAGTLSLSHMRTLIQEEDVKDILIAGDLMVEASTFTSPDRTLSHCTELLAKEELDIIPIVESETNMKLVGYVTRKDILSVYNLEVMKKNLSGFKYISKVGETEQKRYLNLSSKYRVEQISVPLSFINKKLETIDIRKNHNITVLAVDNPHYDGHRIPKHDTVFISGDSLIIVGENEAMDQFLAIL